MGLVKRTYVDGETVITAENLNDIQDAIIQNEQDIATKGTYSKPSGGIPSTDLASAVQTSLGKADSALQSSDIDGTLSVTGKAADAKKTGDEISDVRNTLDAVSEDLYISYPGYVDIKNDFYFFIGASNNYGIDETTTRNRLVISNGSEYVTSGGPDLIEAPFDLFVNHSSFNNVRIGLSYFDAPGSTSNWQGWLSEPFTIPSGQLFKILIKHLDESNIASDYTEDICYSGLSINKATTVNIPPKEYYPIKIVSQDGSSKYSKIQDAIDDADDGDIVYIKSGWYEESVVNTKQIALIGQDKYSTVLFNATGEYATPPLWTCSGRIENMTIYAWNRDNKSFDSLTRLGYAFHLDQKWSETHSERHIEIRNCIFKSDFNDAIGCGIEEDGFIDISDTICEATHRSGMKVHPFPVAGGTSKILLRNNVFKKGVDENAYGLLFHTGGTDGTHYNTVEVEAYNNIAKTYDGWDTNCFIMEDYNYGNTLVGMNRFSLA